MMGSDTSSVPVVDKVINSQNVAKKRLEALFTHHYSSKVHRIIDRVL